MESMAVSAAVNKLIIKEMVFLIWGIICTGFDIQYRAVPRWLAGAGAVLGLGMELVFWDSVPVSEAAVGLLPGIVGLLVYPLCQGRIGFGDILYLLVSGLFLSGQYMLMAVVFGGGFAAAGCMIVLFMAKWKRRNVKNYSMPLIPFLYSGAVFAFLL